MPFLLSSYLHLMIFYLTQRQRCSFRGDDKLETETILKVMLNDHCKIVKLLNDFEKCTDLDKQILKKTFNIFKWELEKHLFTEEKAIFVYFEPDDQ